MKPLWRKGRRERLDKFAAPKVLLAVPRLPIAAVVLVAEADTALVERNEATVRDGDTVGVAGEIGENRLRPGEGRLGVDEPSLPLERREVCIEGLTAPQAFNITKERQPARRMGVGQRGQEEPPEEAGE